HNTSLARICAGSPSPGRGHRPALGARGVDIRPLQQVVDGQNPDRVCRPCSTWIPAASTTIIHEGPSVFPLAFPSQASCSPGCLASLVPIKFFAYPEIGPFQTPVQDIYSQASDDSDGNAHTNA